MLLIIQIILTVRAWKRGLRYLALIPMALAVVAGIVLGQAGLSNGELTVAALVVDLGTIGALAAMNAPAKKPAPAPELATRTLALARVAPQA